MKPSEIIREARNVLFERGWMQGDFSVFDESEEKVGYLPGAPVCAYGALGVAMRATVTGAYGEPCNLLQEAVGQLSVASWNDDPERKFDEVIDAFDRAEKLALIAEESASLPQEAETHKPV